MVAQLTYAVVLSSAWIVLIVFGSGRMSAALLLPIAMLVGAWFAAFQSPTGRRVFVITSAVIIAIMVVMAIPMAGVLLLTLMGESKDELLSAFAAVGSVVGITILQAVGFLVLRGKKNIEPNSS